MSVANEHATLDSGACGRHASRMRCVPTKPQLEPVESSYIYSGARGLCTRSGDGSSLFEHAVSSALSCGALCPLRPAAWALPS